MPHRLFSRAAPTALIIVAACGDPNTLPDPQIENVVDTTVLYALSGTAINLPSAFDVVGAQAVRTDRNLPFDFAFDIETGGEAYLYPATLLGLSGNPGLQRSDQTFDDVLSAPQKGFVPDTAFAIASGDVLIAQSRSSQELCSISTSLPRYAKFHVLAIDQQERTVTLEFLVDKNCGYRGLEPGLPAQ